MPYILSNEIHTELPGLWGEGPPYEAKIIYDIASKDPNSPPVHYIAHTIKPHSIPHVDVPAHIIPGGATVDKFYQSDKLNCFYGPVVLLHLSGNRWQDSKIPGTKVWRVGKNDLMQAVQKVYGTGIPNKLFITADKVPLNEYGFHDPNYVLVLDEEAATWLLSNPHFNAYGTSWKSSDFEPGSRERPIHKLLLRQAVLFECLKLHHVPPGIYFLSAFPINLKGASESPVLPVLFEFTEMSK